MRVNSTASPGVPATRTRRRLRQGHRVINWRHVTRTKYILRIYCTVSALVRWPAVQEWSNDKLKLWKWNSSFHSPVHFLVASPFNITYKYVPFSQLCCAVRFLVLVCLQGLSQHDIRIGHDTRRERLQHHCRRSKNIPVSGRCSHMHACLLLIQ